MSIAKSPTQYISKPFDFVLDVFNLFVYLLEHLIFVVELHCYFTLKIYTVEILRLSFKDYSRIKNSFGYLDFGFNLVYFVYLHLSD